MMLYPIHFAHFYAAEDNPVHHTACTAAGVNSADADVSVFEVPPDDAEQVLRTAGRPLPPEEDMGEGGRIDRFFLVVGADAQGYGRLVHLTGDGVAVRV